MDFQRHQDDKRTNGQRTTVVRHGEQIQATWGRRLGGWGVGWGEYVGRDEQIQASSPTTLTRTLFNVRNQMQ